MVARMGRVVQVLAAAWVLATMPGLHQAAALESPWLDTYKARSRLIAGTVGTGAEKRLYAFVEVAMGPKWKTYWRNPGDAGGIPPAFDWSRSQNLASATVLYPAPKRLVDRAGATIGYKERVVFPVAIAAQDPAKPVRLDLDLYIGICLDICVPTEAALRLEIPPGETGAAPRHAAAALAHVPRTDAERSERDPRLVKVSPEIGADPPRLVLEAEFQDAGAEMFLEAPDGLYIPVPRRISAGLGGREVFEVALGAEEAKKLVGRTIRATLVGETSASDATFKIE